MAKKRPPHIVNQIQSLALANEGGVNYATQKLVSHSQLVQYTECPKKWALKYVDGHKTFQENIHNVFGVAIHNSIQHFIDLMYNKTLKSAELFDIISFFKEDFINNYNKGYKNNKNQHFSNAEEMKSFYDEGVAILNTFISKRGKYFSKRGWWLVGCELPLKMPPDPTKPNILFKGSLDIVLYHEPTNKFEIIDIKTSTRGWGDKTKKDQKKTSQLVLYKDFFHRSFNIPIEDIDVKFFIVKRQIYEDTKYNTSRIQLFEPASGKIKIGQCRKELQDFIDSAFTDGEFIQKEYEPKPSKWNCLYCPFNDNKDLCPVGITPKKDKDS